MRVLIIGYNTKFASVFGYLATDIFLLIDEGDWSRYEDDIKNYYVLTSKINVSLFHLISRVCQIRELIIKHRIDIVFTNEKNSMISSFLASLSLRKRPILLSTSHNSFAWISFSKSFIFSKIIKNTTDGFIALAKFVLDRLILNGIPQEKVLFTPNPIEFNLFEKKTNYSFNNLIPHCIYVGVIVKGKGQDTLIKATALLKRKNINIFLSLVGDILDEAYYRELGKLVQEEGIQDLVDFVGALKNTEIRRCLCNYDIYVCPSSMEMSPYNILEAKSAGLPIIASKVGGVPDIINHNVDGLLISPNNEFVLAESIEMLLNDYDMRKSLGTNALKVAESVHDSQAVALLMSEFLQRIKHR